MHLTACGLRVTHTCALFPVREPVLQIMELLTFSATVCLFLSVTIIFVFVMLLFGNVSADHENIRTQLTVIALCELFAKICIGVGTMGGMCCCTKGKVLCGQAGASALIVVGAWWAPYTRPAN